MHITTIMAQSSRSTRKVVLTLHVIGELPVDLFICLQSLLVVAAATVAAGDHQVPLHLVGPEDKQTS